MNEKLAVGLLLRFADLIFKSAFKQFHKVVTLSNGKRYNSLELIDNV
jgi:hypothetical protein